MKENVLIIGHHYPEPKSSAAGSRMLQLISLFQEQNYQITFACSSSKNDNAFKLSNLGVHEVVIKLNDPSFDVFIRTLQPRIVLFDRFMTEEQFGWRVAEQCPAALKILDTEDLHGLRKGRESALKAHTNFNTDFLFNDTAKREIASIYRCDLSLIISEAEIEILKNNFIVPEARYYYLPFLLETISSEIISETPKYGNRNHFITVGNFLHAPNYDAVCYLKSTIWPLIRKQLPKAQMHIYGAYTPQKITQLHNEKDHFLIKGFVEDVNVVMQQAKVCLAPLRFGAGLKGKLIDAMQNGLPCGMTTIAAEGMFGKLAANGFTTDAPEVFANKAVELYTNDTIWNASQYNGYKIINKPFSKITFKERFFKTISQYTLELQDIRNNNFTGQMLHHQTMQGSKYMSKWIEEKHNKTKS